MNKSETDAFSKADLEEGIRSMDSLIAKCEKAEGTIRQGSSQWTTLQRRLKAFRMTRSILQDRLDQTIEEEMK